MMQVQAADPSVEVSSQASSQGIYHTATSDHDDKDNQKFDDLYERLDRYGGAHESPARTSTILVRLYSVGFNQADTPMPATGQGGNAAGQCQQLDKAATPQASGW
jgi:hypothetical protein